MEKVKNFTRNYEEKVRFNKSRNYGKKKINWKEITF